MEQVTNEKKILRILVKQNMNRKIARILSKIARLIYIFDYTGGAVAPCPPPAPYAYGFIRYKFVSYAKQRLPHSSGDNRVSS